MSTLAVQSASAGSAAIAAAPDVQAAKAAQERARADAATWIASLPSRTTLRRRSAASPHARLVQYRTGASTPEYWEKLWIANPSFRMRGFKLPAWYRDVFTRRLPSDGLIVEAGCGNGNLVRMIIHQDPARWGGAGTSIAASTGVTEFGGAVIEGLDFAEQAIAENQRIHPDGRYRVGDVRELPYADGALSGYLSMGVVEHFGEEDRKRILREAARCLRPGGIAIITVPFFSPMRRLRAMFGGFPDEGRGVSDLEFYQFFFCEAEIRRQVEDAGLRVLEVESYDARKGLTDVIGGSSLLARFEKRSRTLARLFDQPPKPIRRCLGHMVMIVAERKPQA